MTRLFYYRPHNRKELEKQIKTLKPEYKLSRYSIRQLWAMRTRLLLAWEARDLGSVVA